MAELIARAASADLLPIEVGHARLEEVDLGRLTSLAPFSDRQADLSAALEKAYGVPYPGPNTALAKGSVQIIWFGRDLALLAGVDPDARLSQWAALTDQSDAWASVVLSGESSIDVLARLVPVDLRPARFGVGQTVRSLLGHMNVSITSQGSDRVLILVFRSMVETLVDELKEAMEAVAARG